ncbi:hypothetical protein DEU56DRAFT_913395 [Suillus clintonianus]|uniref:uncharacterized protein n=1 Tax=Suillus clintonianus TaxID=1904413 RepID=UPI001B8631A5|nr:uncharacterized protein DEU56DRAFT_913395 [Suillus clintonianus]KAG2135285.1 hypothetical protein DEU56DRAFT_913395 [Suillus clintonianus]
MSCNVAAAEQSVSGLTDKIPASTMPSKDPRDLWESLVFVVQLLEPLQVLSGLLWLWGDRAETLDGCAWLETAYGHDWLENEANEDYGLVENMSSTSFWHSQHQHTHTIPNEHSPVTLPDTTFPTSPAADAPSGITAPAIFVILIKDVFVATNSHVLCRFVVEEDWNVGVEEDWDIGVEEDWDVGVEED